MSNPSQVPVALPSLVIVVAPAGLLGGVRDALQDWSAVGLIRPFCWLQDPREGGAGQSPALEIINGRATVVRLSALMATRNSSRVRLCVLVPEFEGAAAFDPRLESELADLVRLNAGMTVQQEYLRVIVTRPGRWPGHASPAQEGWHNIVLSPEESQGPAWGHQSLAPSDDPFDVGPHAAAGLCGLAGLWSGIDEAPLDGKQFLPAGYLRVARTFFRRLDADTVDAQMRDRVLAMTAGLPLPMVGTVRAEVVEDIELATSSMANQLWAKHSSVLLGPRKALPPVTVTPIGGWELVKQFFAFLGAALRNAPAAWSAALFRQAASGVAAALQNRVLGGSGSAYKVVVSGIGPDGLAADWRDLGQAASQLSEVVSDPTLRSMHAANTDLRHVWRDYVSATLTLADAGDRSRDLPPVAVGTNRGVLPRAGDCAPGPDSGFGGVPEGMRALLGPRPLEAPDVLGIGSARARLTHALTDASYKSEADRVLNNLDQWAAQHRSSFAVQSAARLGRAVTERRDEVRQLLASLQQAGEERKSDAEFRSKQKALARLLTGLLIALVIALIVLGALAGLDYLTWKSAGIIAGSVFVAWLVASLITFATSQRNLFAELHRRQVAESQAEVNATNLGHALLDLRRVSAAYGQHLSWARALGAVLMRPFGGSTARPPRDVLSEDGLPLGVRLGVAAPEPAVIANAVAVIRRGTFRSGWLTTPWELHIADAPRRLGPEGLDLEGDPTRIYGEKAGDGTLLDRWVELISTEGPTVASADLVWQQMNLAATPQADRLVEQVAVGQTAIRVSRETFMGGIEGSKDVAASRAFDGALFTAQSRIADKNAVRMPWSASAREGLTQVSVLVECSEGLGTFELQPLGGSEEQIPVAPDLQNGF